jgi:hypothetical protein
VEKDCGTQAKNKKFIILERNSKWGENFGDLA